MDDEERRLWESVTAAAVAVTSDLDLPSLLTEIVHRAKLVTGARYAALGVLGEDREELVEFLTEGIDDQTAATIGAPPHGAGVLGALLHDGKVLRLENVADHPASVGFPPGHPPMHAFLGVPIRVEGSVFGDLYLAEKEGGFTADDELIVVGLAALAGAAITNARLYAALRRTRSELAASAVAEDRKRIARDLHDLVIGRLFAIGLTMDRVARNVDEPWAGRAAQAVDGVDRAIADLRGAIFALGSDSGTDEARLERLIKAAAAPLGFSPVVAVSGDLGRVPAGLRNDLHAVVNEALANVARHARATTAEVRIDVTDGGVKVTVEDDGVGIGDREPASGLLNLRDRATRADGVFSVGPGAEGRGTKLVWRAPLPIE